MNSSTNPPNLPEDLSFYSYQIAGHHYSKQKEEEFGVLYCKKTCHVLKPMQKAPRGDTERIFYENVWMQAQDEQKSSVSCSKNKSQTLGADKFSLFQDLRRFVPKYYGLTCIKSEKTTTTFLELENLTAAFQKPCIIDIKIGARTWDPLADQAKIDYEKSKYPFAEKLGFRFLGTIVYHDNDDSYDYHDKHWGKMLDEEEILPALRSFLPHDAKCCAVLTACILEKLLPIFHLFQRQSMLSFYSSSLLLIYEGDKIQDKIRDILHKYFQDDLARFFHVIRNYRVDFFDQISQQDLTTSSKNFKDDHNILMSYPNTSIPHSPAESILTPFRKMVDIKMIDFTHVFHQGHPLTENATVMQEGSNLDSANASLIDVEKLDENYLHGLKNLVKFFIKLLDLLINDAEGL